MIRFAPAVLCLALAPVAHAAPAPTVNAPYDGLDWLGSTGLAAALGTVGAAVGLSISASRTGADFTPLGTDEMLPIIGLLAGVWGGAELYGYATDRDGSTLGAILGATLGLGVAIGTAVLLDEVAHTDTVAGVGIVGALLLPPVGATFGYTLGLDDAAVAVPTPGMIPDGAGGGRFGLLWSGQF